MPLAPIDKCRVCGGKNLHTIFKLEDQYVATIFLKRPDLFGSGPREFRGRCSEDPNAKPVFSSKSKYRRDRSATAPFWRSGRDSVA
jgi:hypothetical protein